jgi:hypothetical protein
MGFRPGRGPRDTFGKISEMPSGRGIPVTARCPSPPLQNLQNRRNAQWPRNTCRRAVPRPPSAKSAKSAKCHGGAGSRARPLDHGRAHFIWCMTDLWQRTRRADHRRLGPLWRNRTPSSQCWLRRVCWRRARRESPDPAETQDGRCPRVDRAGRGSPDPADLTRSARVS